MSRIVENNGIRAQKVLKSIGINSTLGEMKIDDNTFVVANWEKDDVQYASTCALWEGIWTFKVHHYGNGKWAKLQSESKNSLKGKLIDAFKLKEEKFCGIYGYFDRLGRCVYIGKDKHIYNLTRHYQHTNQPTKSPIDKAIPEYHLEYRELFRFMNEEEMNRTEVELIKLINPTYNVQHNGGKDEETIDNDISN